MNLAITRYGFKLHDLFVAQVTSKISVSTWVKRKYHLLSHRLGTEMYGVKPKSIMVLFPWSPPFLCGQESLGQGI